MESDAPGQGLIVAILVVAFPIMFVGIWSFVCVILAAVSGWRAMRERYGAPAGLIGAPLASGFSAMVGVASYRGVLRFEATPQGLIARVMKLFPFHPPLLIPWNALRLTRGGTFFAGTMEVLNGATFRLNSDALASIEAAQRAASQPFIAR